MIPYGAEALLMLSTPARTVATGCNENCCRRREREKHPYYWGYYDFVCFSLLLGAYAVLLVHCSYTMQSDWSQMLVQCRSHVVSAIINSLIVTVTTAPATASFERHGSYVLLHIGSAHLHAIYCCQCYH
jgi:hypothetical protein